MGDAHRGATSLLLGLPRGWLASRAAGSTCPHVRLKPVQPSSSQPRWGPRLGLGHGGHFPPSRDLSSALPAHEQPRPLTATAHPPVPCHYTMSGSYDEASLAPEETTDSFWEVRQLLWRPRLPPPQPRALLPSPSGPSKALRVP